MSRLIFAAAGHQFEDIRYESSEWPSHKSKMPLGQMPVLEVGGFKLPQSLSIARFLAKQFNLAGEDNMRNLEILAKAYSNGGSFFVGNHLTWCDLFVYDKLETILQIDASVLSHYPWLQHNRQEVEKQPTIAAYLKSRSQTQF